MWTKALPIGIALSSFAALSWPSSDHTQLDSLIDLSLTELLDVQINSATKINQSLGSIPANVSIVTRSDIKTYGFTSFIELLRNLPGIYLEEDTEEVFIGTRGSIGGSVQLLVNGIPQHPSLQKGLSTVETNRLNIPIAAIDRIEFIRGPMAVIYGNNAFQGTLNVVTHESQENLAKLAAGGNNNNEVFARLHIPLTDGSVGINIGASNDGRFSGDYRDQLGQDQLVLLNSFTQTSAEDNLEKSLKSVDLITKWQSLTATVSYQESDYAIYPSVPPTASNDLTLETWLASLQYQFEINDQWRTKSLLIVSDDEYSIDDVNIVDDQSFGFQYQNSTRLELEQVVTYQNDDLTSFLLGYRLQEIKIGRASCRERVCMFV